MATHLCLLGDATSPHVQRWAREMLQRGYRVSLITARPAARATAGGAPRASATSVNVALRGWLRRRRVRMASRACTALSR